MGKRGLPRIENPVGHDKRVSAESGSQCGGAKRFPFIKKFGGGASMHQSTLAWLARGYVVSFTFIGSSDDEVLQLVEGLTFGKKPAARK